MTAGRGVGAMLAVGTTGTTASGATAPACTLLLTPTACSATGAGGDGVSAAPRGASAVGARGARHAAPMTNAKMPALIGNRQRCGRRPAYTARRRRRRIGPPIIVPPIMAHFVLL